MLNLGEFVEHDQIVKLAGFTSSMATQCGILVNEKEKRTILIQTLDSDGNNPYPNYWDTEVIGLLHYCGTNKGQPKNAPMQNINSKLNKHVNEGIFPILVFVRYPDKKFRYMGEFERIKAFDKWIELFNGVCNKKVINFGLISKNIQTTEEIIKSLISEQSEKYRK